jgi:hypothetical protein
LLEIGGFSQVPRHGPVRTIGRDPKEPDPCPGVEERSYVSIDPLIGPGNGCLGFP